MISTIAAAAVLTGLLAITVLIVTVPHDDSAHHRDLEATIASIPVQAIAREHR